MNDILNFDKMLTPKIITVVYWIMLLGVAIGGLGSMFAGPGGFSISSLFMGVVYAVGGAVAVRIWCVSTRTSHVTIGCGRSVSATVQVQVAPLGINMYGF